ncbi:unnamed protein product [Owenia fusiformis]|uniref:Glycine N-acyltransferase-like protein n=1 Tax=Owenia fusiformis TaxID=6347 RepID=A0A8J1T8N2_OWEFU|nr:unnamed protein product [Owenia fusiformis]
MRILTKDDFPLAVHRLNSFTPHSIRALGVVMVEMVYDIGWSDIIVDKWPDFQILYAPQKKQFLEQNPEMRDNLAGILFATSHDAISTFVKTSGVFKEFPVTICAKISDISALHSALNELKPVYMECLESYAMFWFDKDVTTFNKDQELPHGMYFDELGETDYESVQKSWHYSYTWKSSEYDPRIITMIRHLPTSCIRTTSGALIGFILCTHNFIMGKLFVEPRYRGQGLGGKIVKDLCKKIIKQGMLPYCGVDYFNTVSLNMCQKLGGFEMSEKWAKFDLTPSKI